MLVAVISDIHANLTALEAVIADFGRVGEVWCLGDVVGYGPEPNECVERLAAFPLRCVAGNHDWAAVGRLSTARFNPDARAAAEWTAAALTPASRDFLLNLPTTLEWAGFTLAHGSPRNPIWEYVLDTRQAADCFGAFATQTCLIGHSHVPLIFEQSAAGARYVDPDYSVPFRLGSTRRIVNPGSIGQPRDGDPRASYLRLDTAAASLEFRRVAYDVAATQARMAACGLPARLRERLAYGL